MNMMYGDYADKDAFLTGMAALHDLNIDLGLAVHLLNATKVELEGELNFYIDEAGHLVAIMNRELHLT